MTRELRRNAVQRGAALERRTAKAFGTRRVHRDRYESAPDINVVRLASGLELSIECKHRRTLPAIIRNALEQARRYHPTAAPVAILQAFGERAVAVVPLTLFRQLVGLEPAALPEQPSLLAVGVR